MLAECLGLQEASRILPEAEAVAVGALALMSADEEVTRKPGASNPPGASADTARGLELESPSASFLAVEVLGHLGFRGLLSAFGYRALPLGRIRFTLGLALGFVEGAGNALAVLDHHELSIILVFHKL